MWNECPVGNCNRWLDQPQKNYWLCHISFLSQMRAAWNMPHSHSAYRATLCFIDPWKSKVWNILFINTFSTWAPNGVQTYHISSGKCKHELKISHRHQPVWTCNSVCLWYSADFSSLHSNPTAEKITNSFSNI